MDFNPHVETYSDDAAHLGEMLGLFRQECLDYLSGQREFPLGGGSYDPAKGWERRLGDGRYCLTQFPHGHADTVAQLQPEERPATGGYQPPSGSPGMDKKLNFVGFLGTRSNRAAELNSRADEIVDVLKVLMCEQPDVLLYGTAEWSIEDTNHYNLVVIRNEEAGQRWKEGEFHTREAINKLSPEYYTTVRIHTGVLPDGIDSKELLLKRSVFLDYQAHQKDPNEPIQREEKYWTK